MLALCTPLKTNPTAGLSRNFSIVFIYLLPMFIKVVGPPLVRFSSFATSNHDLKYKAPHVNTFYKNLTHKCLLLKFIQF